MTLTQTAILTKQIIVVSAITLFIVAVGFIGYKIWYAHYLASLPPVEQKPDTKFGILPPLQFPDTSVSSSNYSYSLDTTTGGLPKLGVDPGFDKLVKVYFIIKPYATFLSSDKIQTLAKNFGITNPPKIINEKTYSFSQDNKVLTVDLDSGNFTYTNQATNSANLTLDDDNKLVSDFENTLSSIGVMKDDLNGGRSKINPLTVEGNNLIPAQNRSDASFATVSIWPKDIDKRQIITSDLNKSMVNATVADSASSLDNYLSLNFTYYQVDQSTFATYPTKSPQDAFTDLKSGKGIVLVEPQNPQVSLTSVSLDYFMPDSYTPYLEPVYMFEGPNFVALVPAVSSEFIKTQ